MNGLTLGKAKNINKMHKVINHFNAYAELLKAMFYQRELSPPVITRPSWWSRLSYVLGVAVCCVLVLYLSIDLAAAQASAPGSASSPALPAFSLFDAVQKRAHDQAIGSANADGSGGSGWISVISRLARTTFFILAALEFCWAAAIWALEKDNLSSLATEMIQKIMFVGFFYVLLNQAPAWIPIIIDSFRDVGRQTLGQTEEITPDLIMRQGLGLIETIWHSKDAPSGFFSVIEKLGQIIVAIGVTIGILISHVVIALQLLALNIESYILLAAGALLLAFGSSRWTSEYVSKYLQYTLALGMRLLVLLLILGITQQVIAGYQQTFAFTYEALSEMLAVVLMQAILAIKAPEMGSALMSGGIGFSAGAGKSSVASIASSAMSATSMASSGARSAVSAARAAPSMARSAASGVGSMASGAASVAGGMAAGAIAAAASTGEGFRSMGKIAGSNASTSSKFKAVGSAMAAPAKNAMREMASSAHIKMDSMKHSAGDALGAAKASVLGKAHNYQQAMPSTLKKAHAKLEKKNDSSSD